jgi:hypothetical protein
MYFGGRRQAVDDVAGEPRMRGALQSCWANPSRAAVALLAALLCAFVAAGCGSSSSTSSSSSANSSFIAQANGACRTAYAKVNALRSPKPGKETTKEIATKASAAAVIAQSMLGQLTALTPPASSQSEYTKMLAAWRQEIAQNLVRRQAAIAGEKTRVDEADSQIETLAREFDMAAANLGLKVCAGSA